MLALKTTDNVGFFFSFLLSVFEEGEELAVVDGADGGDGAELCGDDGRGECGQLDGGEGERVGVSAGPACRGVGDGLATTYWTVS